MAKYYILGGFVSGNIWPLTLESDSLDDAKQTIRHMMRPSDAIRGEFRAAQWLDGKFHVYQGGAVDCPLRRGIYTRAAYAEFLESLGIDPKNMMEN